MYSPLDADRWRSRRGSRSRWTRRGWECQSNQSPPTSRLRCYRRGYPCSLTSLQKETHVLSSSSSRNDTSAFLSACPRIHRLLRSWPRNCFIPPRLLFNNLSICLFYLRVSLFVLLHRGAVLRIWLIRFMPWQLNWQRASRVAMRREADYKGLKAIEGRKRERMMEREQRRDRSEWRAECNEEAPGTKPGTKPGNGEHAEIRGAMDLEALNRFQ